MDSMTWIRIGVLLILAGEIAGLVTQSFAGARAFVSFIVLGGGITLIGMLVAVRGMVATHGRE